MATDNKEILDVVDADDKVIDTKSREYVYANKLEYVRVVEAFIKNSDGKLWIPTRIATKKIAPNGFDTGVGGHVAHGETYDEAFRKEVREEIGWNVDDLKYRTVGKFGPKDGLNTVSMVYEIQSDATPTLNSEDFSSAQWLTPQELAKQILGGHPAKTNIIHLLKLVYGATA